MPGVEFSPLVVWDKGAGDDTLVNPLSWASCVRVCHLLAVVRWTADSGQGLGFAEI